MEGPPLPKRKRLVAACIECHRRKQKCNHARPCSNCMARGVNAKCIYEEDGAFQSSEQIEQHSPDFISQAGYSLSSDNNTYTTLQKSLLADPPPTKHSIPVPPRDTQTQDKFRQALGQLPSKVITKDLVENYFAEANWYFLVLEQFYFNQLHKSWFDSKDRGINEVSLQIQHFIPLLFQVLAVSLQFLPLDSACAKALYLEDLKAADHLSYKYSTAGVELMQALGRHRSTIVSVQHDVMRSLWLKNCSRGTESWYSLGDAIKQAQDLGLHLQCHIQQSPSIDLARTLEDLWYDEYKRRLWITLFIWDSHMAFVLGRPRAINILDCTVRTPLDCNIPEQPSKTIPTSTNASDVPSTYSAHLFHYFLAQKIHEILSKGANKPYFSDYSLIQSLDEQVVSQLRNLPPAVRPVNPDTSLDSQYPRLLKQRQHISNAAQSFLIALHRPHVHQHEMSRKVAIQASFACLSAQQQLFNLVREHQYRIYNLSFYTIDAGMFLSAIAIAQPSLEQPFLVKTYGVLCEATTRLNLMQNRSAMAKSGLQLLIRCCQKICLVHGINHETLASMSESSSLQNETVPANSVQFIDQSLSNNLLPYSQVDLGISQPSHISMSTDYANASIGTNSAAFSTPFESIFVEDSYLDGFNGLDPAEAIGDSVWKNLLG